MKILVADDEKIIRSTFERHLGQDHDVVLASSFKEARQLLESGVVDLAFIDLHLDESEELTGTKLIEDMRRRSPTTILIAMTGLEDPELIAKCFDLGASDFIFKPIVSKTLNLIMHRARTLHKLVRRNLSLQTQAGDRVVTKSMLATKSPSFQRVLDLLKKLKGTQDSVLFRGESGVGKDVAARFLWSQEDDDSRPYIPVLAGGITASLAESELFGHKKGAFSGATDNRIGKFEAADGGDLFLDEVATLPMEMQVKLLRVLSNGEITPVGQNIPKKINCRIIAATNEPLEEMVKTKAFREDLLFRLKKITIVIPPLRERREDIPDLIARFLLDDDHVDKHLSEDAIRFCRDYRWPGNVRELEDTIQAAARFAEENTISRTDIESQLKSASGFDMALSNKTSSPSTTSADLEDHIVQGKFNKLSCEYEQRLVRYALDKSGSETAAARYLGIPKSTLQSKRRVWGWNN